MPSISQFGFHNVSPDTSLPRDIYNRARGTLSQIGSEIQRGDLRSWPDPSSLPYGDIDQGMQQRALEVGLDFMNPVPVQGIAGIIGGRGAKVVGKDPSGADRATELALMGKTPQQQMEATNWWLGQDNLARFEIEDWDSYWSPSKYDMTPEGAKQTFRSGSEGTIGEWIEHPVLFENYPQLKDINIKFDDKLKGHGNININYDPNTNSFKKSTITLNPTGQSPEELYSVVLHELQHAVQVTEGFAVGSTPSMFEHISDVLGPQMKKFLDETEISINNIRKAMKVATKGSSEHTRLKEELVRLTKDKNRMKIRSDIADKIAQRGDGTWNYRHTLGEIEANEVEQRYTEGLDAWLNLGYKPEKRMDVPRSAYRGDTPPNIFTQDDYDMLNLENWTMESSGPKKPPDRGRENKLYLGGKEFIPESEATAWLKAVPNRSKAEIKEEITKKKTQLVKEQMTASNTPIDSFGEDRTVTMNESPTFQAWMRRQKEYIAELEGFLMESKGGKKPIDLGEVRKKMDADELGTYRTNKNVEEFKKQLEAQAEWNQMNPPPSRARIKEVDAKIQTLKKKRTSLLYGDEIANAEDILRNESWYSQTQIAKSKKIIEMKKKEAEAIQKEIIELDNEIKGYR